MSVYARLLVRRLFAFLTLSLAVAACTRPKPPALVVTMFDVSGSVASDVQRAAYLTDFSTLLEALSGQDILIGDVMGRSPQAESRFPLRINATAGGESSDNPLAVRHRLWQLRDSASKVVAALLREARPASSSSLVEGVETAARIFSTFSVDSQRRVLVLFTDGIEESEGCLA